MNFSRLFAEGKRLRVALFSAKRRFRKNGRRQGIFKNGLTGQVRYSIVAFSDAGWSSMVARRAHNPKVVGSNPAPATKFQIPQQVLGDFCV